MGLFSRNESASRPERRTASRSSLSSEAQASELRSRARRRLVGALALVLVAVIVVPMLFESPKPTDVAPTPVVVPSIPAPATDMPPQTNNGSASADGYTGTVQQPEGQSAASPDSNTAAQADGTTELAQGMTSPDPEAKPQPEAQPAVKPEAKPKPEPKHEPKAESKPKPAKTPEKIARTDDGSVALALLEGKAPPQSKPSASKSAEKGNFILQIAAYTSDADAQARRERLVGSGVTNAYVEQATSGGKSTYRLRVGPFPSRDAAQAAQARLRALGYDNGFISTK